MGRDDHLTAGVVQKRTPHSTAGALPIGIILRILRIIIGRIHISGIVGGIGIEERNMTESHQEWRTGYFFLLQSVLEPGCLGPPILLALE
jgi:hypothetical protein